MRDEVKHAYVCFHARRGEARTFVFMRDEVNARTFVFMRDEVKRTYVCFHARRGA